MLYLMHILILLACAFASSFAWLPPERCQQGKARARRDTGEIVDAPLVPNIEEIRASQHRLLEENYKDYKFPGVPVNARYDFDDSKTTMYAAHNCSFHTYQPRMLGSIACYSDGCKLTRSVATVESYTASEGYNWGVKITAKRSILGKIFEVGGEASAGGTYTCAYTKGKTTTLTVECSMSSGPSGHLQLYNILTDMDCDFGTMTMEKDTRANGQTGASSEKGFLSRNERLQLTNSAAAFVEPFDYKFFIDPSKIPDRLFQKIMRQFPLYNPYTDFAVVDNTRMEVEYAKIRNYEYDYTKVVPFTNENGDAVYQYACLFTK